MGVPLSKNRVIQSCLDIHYVLNPSSSSSQNGRVLPAVVPPCAAVPAQPVWSEPVQPKPATPNGGNGCKLCLVENPAGSPVSWMSTESVAVDNDSIRSPEHTATVDCWSSIQRLEQDVEVCAVCSSATNEGSLVVQIHASDDQLVRSCNPDKKLFQLPQTVRLEFSDGYYGPFRMTHSSAFSLHCLFYVSVTWGFQEPAQPGSLTNNNHHLFSHLSHFLHSSFFLSSRSVRSSNTQTHLILKWIVLSIFIHRARHLTPTRDGLPPTGFLLFYFFIIVWVASGKSLLYKEGDLSFRSF